MPKIPKQPMLPKFPKDKYLITYRVAEIIFNLVDAFENLFQKRLKNHQSSKQSKSTNSVAGFTLVELLLIITLIALIAVVVFILINPKKQIEKAWDSQRKNDLNRLQKILEDWYNDKNCYPKPEQICYDPQNNPCHICGHIITPSDFSPYLKLLPCDPQQPIKKYLYQVDNLACPKTYRLYADLSGTDFTNSNPESLFVGCPYQSCGPAPDYGFDYGVFSPNTDLERFSYFAYCATGGCNICGETGTIDECENLYRYHPELFCQRKKYIIPAPICGIKNCPCQPRY